MLSSNYTLTYDPAGTPVVLVTVGDRLEAELEFSLEKSVEIVQLIDAAAPFIRVAKNAVVSFQVRKYTAAATDADARTAVLNALITAQTATKKPLKIQVSGTTGYWQFAHATIKSTTPARFLESPKARWVQTWDIVATGLTYTP